MNNKIIDCRKLAVEIEDSLVKKVIDLKAINIEPKFATVLVGDSPASLVYEGNKGAKANKLGIANDLYKLPEETHEKDLISLIRLLNEDKNVHGILVQMPLPKHISTNKILLEILPSKDIDGLTPFSQGLLILEKNDGDFSKQDNYQGFVPCTPLGCMYILRSLDGHYMGNEVVKVATPFRKPNFLEGKSAVVLGRSNLVGIPMAQLLLNSDCSVTVVHSKSRNIKEITKSADIIIVATGVPLMVDKTYIREDTVVIDVGISRVDGKIVGDVNLESMVDSVKAITPVPKGVGPLTIASLMSNIVKASHWSM